MDIWFFAAGGVSALNALIHIFAGGKEVAKPLLSSTDLGTVPRLTAYFCWHITTIVLVAMAAGFLWLGYHPDDTSLAILLTGLAGAFALLSLGLVRVHRVGPLALPQWILFSAIALPGAAALLL